MDKKKIQQLLMSAWQSGTKITVILYIYVKKTHPLPILAEGEKQDQQNVMD